MRWLGLLFFFALFLGAATSNRQQIFVSDGIHFVDADCYSRMTRVRSVLEHPFTRITHHDFENFPQGTDPHTTAPMDWCIAILAAALHPFTSHAVDLAGAWISPILGLLSLVVLWAWSRSVPFRNTMLILFAVSPAIIQGFKLGRPDHQSLLLFLLTCAVTAEWTMWQSPSRRIAVAWGVAWGTALWTSLYEPLILFLVLLVTRLAVIRRGAISKAWLPGAVALAATLVIAVLFDGWRVRGQSPVVTEYFARWSQSIGELASLPPWSPQFFAWIGWLFPLVPVALLWRTVREKNHLLILPLVLVAVTFALTCWQLRWGAFLALFAAMTMPFALSLIRVRPLAWTVFGISLLPIASAWDTMLFPDPARAAALAEAREDYQLLHQVADSLVSSDRTPILAPWWLSPPLAYWSGQPCIAGSSHQSLPGTVETAEFYMSADPSAARRILEDREVRYVVAYEPSRVLSTSSSLLGRNPLRGTMAEVLYSAPTRAPDYLRLVFSNKYFRVYETTVPDSPR